MIPVSALRALRTGSAARLKRPLPAAPGRAPDVSLLVPSLAFTPCRPHCFSQDCRHRQNYRFSVASAAAKVRAASVSPWERRHTGGITRKGSQDSRELGFPPSVGLTLLAARLTNGATALLMADRPHHKTRPPRAILCLKTKVAQCSSKLSYQRQFTQSSQTVLAPTGLLLNKKNSKNSPSRT